MTPERQLAIGTVARRLGVSYQTIRNWIRAGRRSQQHG
jgi:excisionase family DNA binding protein